MNNLNSQYKFNVPKQLIYEAIIDPIKIMQYTRTQAIVNPIEGGQFQLLQGKIKGKFIRLIPHQYIKMLWKFNDWKQYSNVQMIFKNPQEDQCQVILNHTGIPPDVPKDKMESGWKNHIFNPMSQILGYPLTN